MIFTYKWVLICQENQTWQIYPWKFPSSLTVEKVMEDACNSALFRNAVFIINTGTCLGAEDQDSASFPPHMDTTHWPKETER